MNIETVSQPTMADAKELYDCLKENKPFAFARFNDGEMAGIAKEGAVIARGDQEVDASLRRALVQALVYRQDNYFIGVSCSNCFPPFNHLAFTILKDAPNIKLAVSFTNMNLSLTEQVFTKAMEGRRWSWIGGQDQNIKELPWYSTAKEPNIQLLVPNENSWASADELKQQVDSFQEGEVVFLSIGPTARPLAAYYFSKCPNTTFIDIGSTFDNYTRNLWLNCHKRTVKYCRICNFT